MSPPVPRSHPRRPTPSAEVTLGVFHHEGRWKLYDQFAKARAFDSRELALGVAQDAALEAKRRGLKVDLFVQDHDGDLRRLDIPTSF